MAHPAMRRIAAEALNTLSVSTIRQCNSIIVINGRAAFVKRTLFCDWRRPKKANAVAARRGMVTKTSPQRLNLRPRHMSKVAALNSVATMVKGTI